MNVREKMRSIRLKRYEARKVKLDEVKAEREFAEKRAKLSSDLRAERMAISDARRERFKSGCAGGFATGLVSGVKKVAGELKANKESYAKANKDKSRRDVLFGDDENKSPFALNK